MGRLSPATHFSWYFTFLNYTLASSSSIKWHRFSNLLLMFFPICKTLILTWKIYFSLCISWPVKLINICCVSVLSHKCTVTCGQGERQRRVRCFQGNQIVDILQCDLTLMPVSTKSCEMGTCPIWRHGEWGPVRFTLTFDITSSVIYLHW